MEKLVAASCWQRVFRAALPAVLVAGILAVPAVGLVSAVKKARRAAQASATT